MKPYYQDDFATIYHGDCREILPSLPKFDMVLTDPPYGIDFASQPTTYQRAAGMKPEQWDAVRIELPPFNADTIVIWGGNYFALPISRGWLSWYKPDAPPSMGNVELAWTNKDRNCRQINHSIAATNAERVGHPTQKPLAVMLWTLSQFPDCKTILDPYMGSGTTLRAAKDLGRQCVGIEINEHYCELAKRRLSQEVFAL
jgi:site-specific DNA-methyltransferase (adenine-specific)